MNDEWVTVCPGEAEVPFGQYGANCVLAVGRMPFLPALAGRRFRFAILPLRTHAFLDDDDRPCGSTTPSSSKTEWCIGCSRGR